MISLSVAVRVWVSRAYICGRVWKLMEHKSHVLESALVGRSALPGERHLRLTWLFASLSLVVFFRAVVALICLFRESAGFDDCGKVIFSPVEACNICET